MNIGRVVNLSGEKIDFQSSMYANINHPESIMLLKRYFTKAYGTKRYIGDEEKEFKVWVF